ncbi:hypothetical protein ScalyP_jg6255 [Parmales sp. scaly parma]|nr:hypothetical protein ScalyP_jg6255 [Parmales sp. scaly parma]
MGGPGLNATDPFAKSVHGTNAQNLIEKITRNKIYASIFWKESCFGLDAEQLLDKAVALKYVGGSFGGNMVPTSFLCLVLKMLQIECSDDIVFELVRNEQFKYVRLLGAFYLRLTGRPADIYNLLEPLLNDYRKVNMRLIGGGWGEGWTVDKVVEKMLNEAYFFEIALPRLPKREALVELGYLETERRETVLEEYDTVEKVDIRLLELTRDGDDHAEAEVAEVAPAEDSISAHGVEKSVHPEGSDEYWDEQRAKLGLKPLKKNNSNSNSNSNGPSPPRKQKEKKTTKRAREEKEKEPKTKKAKGSLFKKSTPNVPIEEGEVEVTKSKFAEGSDEYWNEQRQKLGMSKLK